MTTGSQRIDMKKSAPEFYSAMIALDSAAKSGLDVRLVELVRSYASLINGCAYCLDMHIKDARTVGESEQRINLLGVWRESPGVYTEQEEAAFALTEAVTLVTQGHVPDEVYERAAEHFSDEQLAQLMALVITMNAWNRVSVATRLAPPVEKHPA